MDKPILESQNVKVYGRSTDGPSYVSEEEG